MVPYLTQFSAIFGPTTLQLKPHLQFLFNSRLLTMISFDPEFLDRLGFQ
jgi:hypothetical protein